MQLPQILPQVLVMLLSTSQHPPPRRCNTTSCRHYSKVPCLSVQCSPMSFFNSSTLFCNRGIFLVLFFVLHPNIALLSHTCKVVKIYCLGFIFYKQMFCFVYVLLYHNFNYIFCIIGLKKNSESSGLFC